MGKKNKYPKKIEVPSCIEVRKSPIHGTGVFAKEDIKKGQPIIQYTGRKITKKESYERAIAQMERSKGTDEGAVYIFDLNKRYDLDGNVPHNPGKYINHTCEPNCKAYNVDGEIWVHATKRIKTGQELGYNYGYDIEHYQEHPCHCGTENCVGYIVKKSQWKKLKKFVEKDNKKSKQKG
ncbi:MAG: SET domain-containing protein-lysine N-methyltransferase [Verrucomicrobiota bacterium]